MKRRTRQNYRGTTWSWRDIRGIVIARFIAEDVVIYGPPEMLPDDVEEGERDRGR